MRNRVRALGFLAAAGVVAAGLVRGMIELPPFGRPPFGYGSLVNRVGPELLAVTNMTAAVNFAFRAMDTLVEESLFFAGVISVALLLREAGEEDRARLPVERTPASQWLAPWSPLLLCAVGLYLIVWGHLTPGGGFQGGVLLAGALLSVYLHLGFPAVERIARGPLLEGIEALAMGGYLLIGLLGFFLEGAFLANILPTGRIGRLTSGGMIPVLDILVGVAVGAGLGSIIIEFLEEVVTEPRQDRDAARGGEP